MAERLITVSLEPAVNVTLWMDTLSAEQKNIVKQERIEPSGGSLNVSRVLKAFDCDSDAMGLYGEQNGAFFIRLLEQCGLSHDFIPCKGEVVQNVTMVLPKSTVIQTQRSSFAAGYKSLQALQQRVAEKAGQYEDTVLIFAEDNMQRLSGAERIRFIRQCCKEHARPILCLNGLHLADLQGLNPLLVMIELSELKAIAKVNFRNEATMLRHMQTLTESIPHIVVHLGAKGFLYAGRDACYRIVLQQNKLSHPESRDYFLGGFLAGMQKNLPLAESLTLAGASAAWLSLCEAVPFDAACAERAKQTVWIEKMKNDRGM